MQRCELCESSCGQHENVFWHCPQCQHWTAQRTYADVLGTYNSGAYHRETLNAHGGDINRLKAEWNTNVDIIRRFISTGRALEIGCRDGAGIVALKDAGFAAWGFDVSNEARHVCESVGIASDRIVIADSYASSLFPLRFDLITIREVIEHVPQPLEMLDEVHASLKPNGVIQVQTPRYHPDVRFWSAPEHLRIYSTSSLILSLERTGFEVCDLLQWPGGVCVTARPVWL